jgi:meso-butanediol dehydrogenase/(S,S)-butanediol dehydrogenase/diacetyl reductase
MDVRLDGKVALVTGGAGGFGRAYSVALAEAGARVAVADVDLEGAKSVAAAIGAGSRAYRVDLRSSVEVERLVDHVAGDFAGLDILVNVAGRSGRFDTATMAEEDWDTIIDGNLKGTFLACKFAIPHLRARGGGRIINMGSNRGIEGQARGAAYAASKGGVLALSRSLARELAPDRITVNVLAPGVTDTAMWRRAHSAEEVERQLASGMIGQPEDLAPLVVLLASDLADQVTGMTLLRDVFMPR